MRLLFDTHTLLWAIAWPERLPQKIHRLVLDPRNEISVSAVSLFELAARNASGRNRPPWITAGRLLELVRKTDYLLLPLLPEHAIAVETIAPLHRDPFDRLLLAQAQVQGLQLVTHDEALAEYDPGTILF